MADLPPRRLLDAALARERTRPDDHVWHFVMHRAGTAPARGERLATLALGVDDVAAMGRAELARTGLVSSSGGDAYTVGLAVLDRALEAERREWVRRLARAGYVDGWGVGVVAERGYRRTVFPGVGVSARLAVAPRMRTTAP